MLACQLAAAQVTPALGIDVVEPGSVRLAWDSAQPDWVLEQAGDLGGFSTVLMAPSFDGTEIALTVTNAGPRAFWRLRAQETSGVEGGRGFLRDSQGEEQDWQGFGRGTLLVSSGALHALVYSADVDPDLFRALLSGLDVLASRGTNNNDDLARKVIALAQSGRDVDAEVAALFESQNSGSGGWGIAASYSDTHLDTALVLRALDTAGVPTGLTVVGDEIPGGQSSIGHTFEVPAGATSLFLTVNSTTGNARFNLTGPAGGTTYFDATPGGVPTNVNFGTPVAGTWTLSVDNQAGMLISYAAEAHFTTDDSLDVSRLTSAATILGNGRNGDGGWPLFVGGESFLLSTCEVMITLAGLGGGFDELLEDGANWLWTSHRNADGGFSSEPDNSNALETALAILAIKASGASLDLAGSSSFLDSLQLLNGSWDNDPYVTAMAIRALHVPSAVPQPPVILPIPDQTVIDPAPFATINLDDYVEDPDHPDDQIVWTAFGVTGESKLTVSIVNRVATITYVPGSPEIETFLFTATDPSGHSDSVGVTFQVTTAPAADYTIARGGSVSDTRSFTTTPENYDQVAFYNDSTRSGIPAEVSYTTTQFTGTSPDTFTPTFQIQVGPSAPTGIHTFTVEYKILDGASPSNELTPVFDNVFEFTIEITP